MLVKAVLLIVSFAVFSEAAFSMFRLPTLQIASRGRSSTQHTMIAHFYKDNGNCEGNFMPMTLPTNSCSTVDGQVVDINCETKPQRFCAALQMFGALNGTSSCSEPPRVQNAIPCGMCMQVSETSWGQLDGCKVGAESVTMKMYAPGIKCDGTPASSSVWPKSKCQIFGEGEDASAVAFLDSRLCESDCMIVGYNNKTDCESGKSTTMKYPVIPGFCQGMGMCTHPIPGNETCTYESKFFKLTDSN